MNRIAITELFRRDLEGTLRPLEGMGEDGRRYFIKQLRTDKRPLLCEWIGGRLAQLLRLPVPDFAQVTLSPDLVENAPEPFRGFDFVSGIAFASAAIPEADRFAVSHTEKVDQSLRLRIAIFDWWILNTDRWVQNPNLMWEHGEQKLHLIDHHQVLAGDAHRPIPKNHVFRKDMVAPVTGATRRGLEADLRRAFGEIDQIFPNCLRSGRETWRNILCLRRP